MEISHSRESMKPLRAFKKRKRERKPGLVKDKEPSVHSCQRNILLHCSDDVNIDMDIPIAIEI